MVKHEEALDLQAQSSVLIVTIHCEAIIASDDVVIPILLPTTNSMHHYFSDQSNNLKRSSLLTYS